VSGKRLALVLVPTTGGTGSEATPYAVITRPNGDKVSITDRQSVPDLALLDAELLIGMPAGVTAATGFDAMVHAIEAFTSRVCKNPISDTAARKAFRLLWQALPESLENPKDLAAREDALIGAMLAGQAIANAPVGGIHALAYPLGGLHHVAHGLANAILMPHVMRFNLQDEATVVLYADLARDVLTTTSADSDRGWAEALIDRLAAMVQAAPIASTLGECGIGESDLDRLAVEAVGIERLLRNNPLPISREAAENIYRRAL
ncbi:MAG: iron-containing alcohol dehydrogenase, partial [Sphingomonadales bacterium]